MHMVFLQHTFEVRFSFFELHSNSSHFVSLFFFVVIHICYCYYLFVIVIIYLLLLLFICYCYYSHLLLLLLLFLFTDAFDKRDPMQSGTIKISRAEVS
jgi:hypothetical protein